MIAFPTSDPAKDGKTTYSLVVTITLVILGVLAHFKHFSVFSESGDAISGQ